MIRVAVLATAFACVFAGAAHADDLTPQERHAVALAYLEGNIEHLAAREMHAKTPGDRLPFALRDLWWRPDPRAHAKYEADAKSADGLVGERYAWLYAAPPRGPFPMAEIGENDPWPMISALVADRVQREREGAAGLPERSPISRLAVILDAIDHAGGLDEDAQYRLWFLNHARNQLSDVVEGTPPTDAMRAADAEARQIVLQNEVLAALAIALLVAGTLFLGYRWRASGSAAPVGPR